MRKAVVWSVLGLALLVVAAASVQAQGHAYTGAEKCKMCHKQQFTSWQTTTHAKATEAAKASTERKFDASCLKCHATNSSETLSGVQCEACHGPGADYQKMSIMKDKNAAVANGLIIPTQATCDGCHTGQDHAKKVVLADQKSNKAAIHEFKAAAAQ
jgi:RecJ-like exonuclease